MVSLYSASVIDAKPHRFNSLQIVLSYNDGPGVEFDENQSLGRSPGIELGISPILPYLNFSS